MLMVFKKMLKENGEYSLTRAFATLGYLSFLLGSGYLIVNNITWGNYETFALVAGGGGTLTQIGNKYLNKKFGVGEGVNSPVTPAVKE